MENPTTTIQDWWENAQASGKVEFTNLANLARRTGLSEAELKELFKKRVATLGEWWDVIGKLVYKTQRKLAEKLTKLLPVGWRYPRSTLGDQIREGIMPNYVQYYNALYAITALPIFRSVVASQTVTRKTPQETIEQVSEKIIMIKISGGVLVRELETLSLVNLTPRERQRLKEILFQVSDQIENWQLSQQLNELFQEGE